MDELLFALCPQVTSQPHGNGSCDQLCQPAIDHNFRLPQRRKPRSQGERDRQAVREADNRIGDHPTVDFKARVAFCYRFWLNLLVRFIERALQLDICVAALRMPSLAVGAYVSRIRRSTTML